jgi:hypothetical protein
MEGERALLFTTFNLHSLLMICVEGQSKFKVQMLKWIGLRSAKLKSACFFALLEKVNSPAAKVLLNFKQLKKLNEDGLWSALMSSHEVRPEFLANGTVSE